jgi:hypothetical protein
VVGVVRSVDFVETLVGITAGAGGAALEDEPVHKDIRLAAARSSCWSTRGILLFWGIEAALRRCLLGCREQSDRQARMEREARRMVEFISQQPGPSQCGF